MQPTGSSASVPSAADTELHRRLVYGDESALTEAYRIYGGLVRGVAARVTRSPLAAGRPTGGPWNGCAARPDTASTITPTTRRCMRSRMPDRSPDETVVNRERALLPHTALAELPQPQREVVHLAHFAGRTYRQAAAELGIPEGSQDPPAHGVTHLGRVFGGPSGLRRAPARRAPKHPAAPRRVRELLRRSGPTARDGTPVGRPVRRRHPDRTRRARPHPPRRTPSRSARGPLRRSGGRTARPAPRVGGQVGHSGGPRTGTPTRHSPISSPPTSTWRYAWASARASPRPGSRRARPGRTPGTAVRRTSSRHRRHATPNSRPARRC
ncbi:Sigma-70, region 4 [Streptomyces sp. 3213]|nr:Sigma-70, region 4 [Streptomyces sp. 3213] [Streptomyces sp. 3213.3]